MSAAYGELVNGCTSYLLDDNQIMRAGLRLLLQQWGCQVLGESSNPFEALTDIQRLQPRFVVLAHNLRGGSGLEFLAGVHSRGLDIATVVLTGSHRPNHLAMALNLGAKAFVLKQSEPEELHRAIQAVMQKGTYLCNGAGQLAQQVLGQHQPSNSFDQLSWREQHIVQLVAQGRTSRWIAELLRLSPKTIATYRSRSMRKLGVRNVGELVRVALQGDWIDTSPKK